MTKRKSVRVDPKRRKRKAKRRKGKSIKNLPRQKLENKSSVSLGENMNRQMIEEIARDLSQRRSLLLQEVAESQDEVKAILEQQESELEESAQKDQITSLTSRLKERDRQKIREIDAALNRLSVGTYAKCEKCEQEIGVDRLRALPTTTVCINCAAARENKKRSLDTEDLSERLPVRNREEEE